LYPQKQTEGGLQLSRVEAWRVLRAAGQKIGLENIGTHTLRKTFGYHMYKRSGRDIALVQDLLNHGSPRQTLRYIGISQEEKDEAYLDLNL
jgi:integrase